MQHFPVPLTVPKAFQGPERYVYKIDGTDVAHWSRRFRIYKACFDKGLALFALGPMLIAALILLLLNPVLNPGPLFYCQTRIGKNKEPFTLWKFRSMTTGEPGEPRGVDDSVETNRITPLGRVLRKLRIDELPNFINVLRGEMSVIGPRPDAQEHAKAYSVLIDHYDLRFKVKPGITGLAQIESGYAEGVEATTIKAYYDQIYVETSCGRLDVYIAFRTIGVMLTGFGAK